MEIDEDISSDELHIDEGPEHRTRNNLFSNTRGHYNAFSSNVGAYNDALLGFGGRGNALDMNPPFNDITSSFIKGIKTHTQSNISNNVPEKSRTSSHKRFRKSGKVPTQRPDIADIEGTTAEHNVSSSNFLSQMNMAMPGSFPSHDMENENSYWGAVKRSPHGFHKR